MVIYGHTRIVVVVVGGGESRQRACSIGYAGWKHGGGKRVHERPCASEISKGVIGRAGG